MATALRARRPVVVSFRTSARAESTARAHGRNVIDEVSLGHVEDARVEAKNAAHYAFPVVAYRERNAAVRVQRDLNYVGADVADLREKLDAVKATTISTDRLMNRVCLVLATLHFLIFSETEVK